MKKVLDELTYAYKDVLVMPRRAEVMPSEVDTTTKFSRNITLKRPLCSAAMSTVTRSRLAIQMALCGGIGVLDRHMSIEEQCNEVRLVKREMSEVLTHPYTLRPDDTIADARNLMQEKSISGIPITDTDGRLVGIITGHDLRFNGTDGAFIEDVMTKKDSLIVAPVGTTLDKAREIFHKTRLEKLPLVDDDFVLMGLITLKDTEKRKRSPHATLDPASGQLRVGAAVGATGDYYERATALIGAGVDAIVIDSSHGHSINVFNALTKMRNAADSVDVIAGNVATAEAARALCDLGADGVKVGIGPASICTTRIVSGAGVPQISAIMWAAEGVDDKIPIIADGGIEYSGDITKAIAAGASSVMIGSLFAGTDESPGETILYNGRMYKTYYGMGSEAVLREGGDRYGSKAVPEGVEGMVPHKGPLADMFGYLIGGLRQGMGYAGCATIEELRKNSVLLPVTDAGDRESHIHGVMMTKQPPNYQIEQ